MTLHLLQNIILVLLGLLISLWFIIAIIAIFNKLKLQQKQRVKQRLIDFIAYNYNQPTKAKYKQHWLQEYMSKAKGLQHTREIIDELKGFVQDNEQTSFTQLIIQNKTIDLVKKQLKSNNWYTVANAVITCYELELHALIDDVISLRNHKNKLVRREVQIAIIVLLGWKSLKLFRSYTLPISLWQQIRIIEKLQEYYPEVETKFLEKALTAKNIYIQELLLRLIRKFELTDYYSFIVEKLDSHSIFFQEIAVELLEDMVLPENEARKLTQKLPNIQNAKHHKILLETLQNSSE